MPKQQTSGLVGKILKNIISLLPTHTPVKIYKALRIFPPFKWIMNKMILSAIPREVNIEEGVLELDQSDPVVSGTLALNAFENTGIDIFRRSIKPGSVVVDIGAHIGYYTVVASKRVGPAGKVFSFEPERENFSRLERNVALNKLINTTLIPRALSNRAGNASLYIDKENKGHHALVSHTRDTTSIIIETETLDGSLAKHGSPKVDIIKMDVEGAEPRVLEGMRETIKRNPKIILFTEFYPRAIERCGGNPLTFLKNMADLGFSLSLIDEERKCLIPIIDIEQFVNTFPRGESFKNIYASKGHMTAHQSHNPQA